MARTSRISSTTQISFSFLLGFEQISQNSVKSKKRSIKSLIKLDTNIQIKLDSNDPETNQQFIEKGFDEIRGMKYYKVFYNSEDE